MKKRKTEKSFVGVEQLLDYAYQIIMLRVKRKPPTIGDKTWMELCQLRDSFFDRAERIDRLMKEIHESA